MLGVETNSQLSFMHENYRTIHTAGIFCQAISNYKPREASSCHNIIVRAVYGFWISKNDSAGKSKKTQKKVSRAEQLGNRHLECPIDHFRSTDR